MRDFFDHQERARKATRRLYVGFFASLVATIGAFYLVLTVIFGFANISGTFDFGADTPFVFDISFSWWNPTLLAFSVAFALVLIVGGSWMRLDELRKAGGEAIAEELGGQPVAYEAQAPEERVLLNVIEEMAVASGMPVPSVYLLDDEAGINAFAAGTSPTAATIAVTRGAIEQLDRGELQGVIAHEFSHILHGDMAMNIRMMGTLNGIMLIGLIGSRLIRQGRRQRAGAVGQGLLTAVIGGLIAAVGYGGKFAGQVVKATISRQREFLADAAAVQFTRNPDGLRGALQKIAAGASHIRDVDAEEASHMFFADVFDARGKISEMISTHPPIAQRLARLGGDVEVSSAQHRDRPVAAVVRPDEGPVAAGAGVSALAGKTRRFGPEGLERAGDLLAEIPDALRQAAGEPLGASAIVLAMLMHREEVPDAAQFHLLEESTSPAVVEETRRLHRITRILPTRVHLPLVETLVPVLRRMSADQMRAFLELVEELIWQDEQLSLFEFSVEKVLQHSLAPHPAGRGRHSPAEDIACVLSALARFGHADTRQAQRAFEVGVERLHAHGLQSRQAQLDDEIDFRRFDAALDRLAGVAADIREAALEACVTCVLFDHEVVIEEQELLRAVCLVMGCPVPPTVSWEA